MSKVCPGCGAKVTAEARFCRQCGAPLVATSVHSTDPPVSPQAETVPLTGARRTTDGLSIEDERRASTATSSVKQAEMEELLIGRSSSKSVDGANALGVAEQSAYSDELTKVAPETRSLEGNGSRGAISPKGARRIWPAILVALAGAILVAGLIAVLSSRRSTASRSSEPPSASSVSETQPAASAGEQGPQTNSASAEAPSEAGQAGAPASSSQPAAPSSVESARATDNRRAQTPTAPSSTAGDSATGQPVVKTNAPPALSAAEQYQRGLQLWTSDRQAALAAFRVAAAGGVADAYYYLGLEYYTDGRDPRTMSDGELRAALNYFLRSGGGPHASEAQRFAERLGKEYERRKRQKR